MRCPKCEAVNPPETHFCGQCGTSLNPADLPTETLSVDTSKTVELSRGSLIADRYEIIEEIGQGGMGKVLKVFDKKIHEKIAVKLIRRDIASEPTTLQRFNQELKIARKIVHKNVCRMYDIGEFKGNHYITMEYVSGEDLRSLIKRIGQFTFRKAVFVAKQVCEGLAEAHAMGIVHRDLKPQNIMIDMEGNARIMDFGIARSVQAKGITETGMIIGTPEYMSPEQVEGKDVDPRSDIYSLGIILYEMLTGQVPFCGNTPMSIAIKQKIAKPRHPRELNASIPEGLSRLILKCLEKEPDKRYGSATALLADLQEMETSLPATDKVQPQRKSGPAREITVKFSPRKFIIPGAVGLVVLAIVLGLWLFRPSPDKQDDRGLTIKNLLVTARKSWENKEYASALEQFRKVLAKDPKIFEAQLRIADILREQGRQDEAVVEYKKASAIDPGHPLPFRSLGELSEEKGEIGAALAYYRECLSRSSGGPEAKDIDLKIKALQKRLDDEKNRFQREEDEAREREIQAGLALARKALEAGRYQAAVDEAQKVLARDSQNLSASNIIKLARRKITEEEISGIIRRYVQALKDNALLSFYKEAGTPQLCEEIQADTELISRLYDGFQADVSRREIRFSGNDQAEVSFGHKIVGISNGVQQVLFEGTYFWTMERHESGWKITAVRSQATAK